MVLKLHQKFISRLDQFNESRFYSIQPNLLWNTLDLLSSTLTGFVFNQIQLRASFLIAIQI